MLKQRILFFYILRFYVKKNFHLFSFFPNIICRKDLIVKLVKLKIRWNNWNANVLYTITEKHSLSRIIFAI